VKRVRLPVNNRPCEFCGHALGFGYRNRKYHSRCARLLQYERLRIRNDCRRADMGLWPHQKKSLEDLDLKRRPSPGVVTGPFVWRTCVEMDCSLRFIGHKNARRCEGCARARQRVKSMTCSARRRRRLGISPRRHAVLVIRRDTQVADYRGLRTTRATSGSGAVEMSA
jgi:hypothetical protein